MKENKRRISLKNLITVIAVAILLIVACVYYFYNRSADDNYYGAKGDNFVFGTECSTAASDLLTVHFIDVGQGDCTFIQFPDGKNMLIDGGAESAAESVIDYLDGLKITKIDLVLATHSDADHIGALPAVFEKYDIAYCFRPMIYYGGAKSVRLSGSFNLPSLQDSAFICETDSYFNFLNAVNKEGCGWSFFNKDSDFSQTFTYNGAEKAYSFDFFTPVSDVKYISYKEANDYSPLCMLSYVGFSVMFTGDAEEYTENEFLNYYKNKPYPDVDLLKVGHHGSQYSTSIDFVNEIKPEYAVISCGKDNEYGHPSSAVLQNLDDCWIYRTDKVGNVVVTIDGNGYANFDPSIEEIL